MQLLKHMMSKMCNADCADCATLGVAFLSCTLGSFHCKKCAMVHAEKLPESISIVVPLSDEALEERNAWINHPIAPQILLYANYVGNHVAKQYWENTLHLPRSSISKLAVFDSRESFIIDKYKNSQYTDEVFYYVKLRKRKSKKRWMIVDDVEKVIYIYSTDPSSPVEVIPETTFFLKETTLQYDNEAGVLAFTLINKGSTYTVEPENPRILFDLMFAIHRCCETVMDSSPFHLGKWLDRIGFYSVLNSMNLDKVCIFLCGLAPVLFHVPETDPKCGYSLSAGASVLRRGREICCDAR